MRPSAVEHSHDQWGWERERQRPAAILAWLEEEFHQIFPNDGDTLPCLKYWQWHWQPVAVAVAIGNGIFCINI